MQKSKTMATFILGTAIVLGTTAAFADGHRGHRGEKSIEHKIERISKKLDLDDAQKAQIEQIFQAHKAETDAIKEQRKALRETIKSEITVILTPEQAEKFEKMSQRHGRGHHGEKGHHDKDNS